MSAPSNPAPGCLKLAECPAIRKELPSLSQEEGVYPGIGSSRRTSCLPVWEMRVLHLGGRGGVYEAGERLGVTHN